MKNSIMHMYNFHGSALIGEKTMCGKHIGAGVHWTLGFEDAEGGKVREVKITCETCKKAIKARKEEV